MESLGISCLVLLSIISTASLAVQMWDIRYLWPQRNSTIRTVLLSSYNPYDTLVGGEIGVDREVILGLSIPGVRNWFRSFIFSSDFGRLNMYPGNISNCIPRSINISIFMSAREVLVTAVNGRLSKTQTRRIRSTHLCMAWQGYITSSLICSSLSGWW